MLGVTAAHASNSAVLTAGVAGLAAGALSMAAGEYVSVSSQKDSEHADIAIERRSLADNPDEELAELAHIYVHRGLEPKLADEVARQLHDHDAEIAHLRDELGIEPDNMANPAQASAASAISFSVGAFIPILAPLLLQTMLIPGQFWYFRWLR
jgi:VIT1/CCC1 family predicted Fe2+/Mn2+ transporter